LLQPGNASVSTIAHQGHSLCQVRVGSKGKLEQLEYSIVRGALLHRDGPADIRRRQ